MSLYINNTINQKSDHYTHKCGVLHHHLCFTFVWPFCFKSFDLSGASAEGPNAAGLKHREETSVRLGFGP